MIEDLIEAWQIHNRINIFLLDAAKEHLGDQASSKGRAVGAQFAHLHNVRLAWLGQSKLDLPDKITKADYLNADFLKTSLTDSGLTVEKLLQKSHESGKNLAYFKPSIVAFASYLITHESDHRGQIVLALKQSGHALDKKALYDTKAN